MALLKQYHYRLKIKNMFPRWIVNTSAALICFMIVSINTIGCTPPPPPPLPETDINGVPSTGMYYFHADPTRNTSYITDEAGNKISQVYYKPFGEVYSTEGRDIFRYKYNSQEMDKESGLVYYKARYYDPALGRFITPDTFVPGDRSQALNRFSYVENNPINYCDPSGHFLIEAGIILYAIFFDEVNKAVGDFFKKWSGWKDGGERGLIAKISSTVFGTLVSLIDIYGFGVNLSWGWTRKHGQRLTFGLDYKICGGKYGTVGLSNTYYERGYKKNGKWQENWEPGVSYGYKITDDIQISAKTSYDIGRGEITTRVGVGGNYKYGSFGVGVYVTSKADIGTLIIYTGLLTDGLTTGNWTTLAVSLNYPPKIVDYGMDFDLSVKGSAFTETKGGSYGGVGLNINVSIMNRTFNISPTVKGPSLGSFYYVSNIGEKYKISGKNPIDRPFDEEFDAFDHFEYSHPLLDDITFFKRLGAMWNE